MSQKYISTLRSQVIKFVYFPNYPLNMNMNTLEIRDKVAMLENQFIYVISALNACPPKELYLLKGAE